MTIPGRRQTCLGAVRRSFGNTALPLVALALSLWVVPVAHGQTAAPAAAPPDTRATGFLTVDPQVGVREIAALVDAARESELSTEVVYLLDGLITNASVIDSNRDSFYAEAELSVGEWTPDGSAILRHMVLLTFDAPQFADRFPAAREEPRADAIVNNRFFSVFARFLGAANIGSDDAPYFIGVMQVESVRGPAR